MSQAADAFHREFYDAKRWYINWLGVTVLKYPGDLFVYQEILHERKPDLLIECGTYAGGSAWYFATIMDLIGHGRVVTVDPYDEPPRPTHPRLTYVRGGSTDAAIVQQMAGYAFGLHRVMVVLDSDHSRPHVLREMQLYGDLVTHGDYLVVEDTNINGHPVYPEHGPGPMEAVAEFLATDQRFEVDRSREKFVVTANPSGWLRRR